MEVLGGIEEASYGLVRGRVEWKDGRDEPIRLVLQIAGKAVAHLDTAGNHFELDAGVALLPSEPLEVLAFNTAGRQLASFKWGEIDRQLPPGWSAGSSYRCPSFFVLGAAKSGTTSLHVYLDQHHEIFMSKPKEPFFFEAEYERGAQFYYNKYFGGWKGQRAVGESRHRNLYLPYVPARIFSYNPEARLIVLLRNPAERAVSHWWHWRSRDLEPLTAEAAFNSDMERIASGMAVVTPQEIADYAQELAKDARGQHRTYIDSGYYFDQLQRYLQYFRRDQLHVLLFEEFIRQPTESLRQVFQFLQVDEAVAPWVDVPRFNQSNPGMWDHISHRLWSELIDHYAPHNRRLEQLLGRSVSFWDSAPQPKA